MNLQKKESKNIPQSFIVTIQYTQHKTWQGTIEWIGGQKKENFRSTLEMLNLISSALERENQD